MKGYIPMVPHAFSDKPEDWRQWQDDVMDLFDNVNPGMKEFMKIVEVETETVDQAWLLDKQDTYPVKMTSDELQVWRALKKLPTGEAKKVVTSIKNENGFPAW